MEKKEPLSRRDFIKGTVLGSAALSINPDRFLSPSSSKEAWPSLEAELLPRNIREIMRLAPEAEIDNFGYLKVKGQNGNFGRVPFARTKWNEEHQNSRYRLNENVSWGIVLHWNGDEDGVYKDLEDYLRGFDGLREINGQMSRTSVHFLLGENEAITNNNDVLQPLGIAQIQAPDKDGVPFAGVHAGLGGIDYERHQNKEQYFVRALYQLGFGLGKERTVLQDFFDGVPKINPNFRTIGIEIAGINFDTQGSEPGEQKIANTLSTVCAIMKRYQIRAIDILGHNEIQLNKADPGKKFMNQIRMLVGLKALVENDDELKELTFGSFMNENEEAKKEAVKRYFDFVRNYTALTAGPKDTFEWEKLVGYWNVREALFPEEKNLPIADKFSLPIEGEYRLGNKYLIPENHEGVDFNNGEEGVINGDLGTPILSVANGECIYKGNTHSGLGKTIAIKHRLPEGAEVISIYGHLDEMGEEIKVGRTCELGEVIGTMGASGNQPDSHLHFSIAYGAMEERIRQTPFAPDNVGPSWVRARYAEPISFLEGRKDSEVLQREIEAYSLKNIIQ